MDQKATQTFENIVGEAETASRWVDANILTAPVLMQLGVLLMVGAFSVLMGRLWSRRLDGGTLPHSLRLTRLHMAPAETGTLLVAVALTWVSFFLLRDQQLPFALVRWAAVLVSSWAVIRVLTAIISDGFISRTMALVLWGMLAFSMAGWIDHARDFMDRLAIDIGKFHLSLLLVFKAVLAFGLLFWFGKLITTLLSRSFERAHTLSPSQRVLFSKLGSITVYALGFMIGLNVVGIDLTTLTVFSGALGLGIGFGLQKVFSNFISGIILLLDRSVKPGDVIAINDTYGWVNSLGARCVSVLTRDGKEHLIPNEHLITNQVENWSFSDSKVRIHIPIGVSYGADIHKVREILLKAVEDHPRILKVPKPVCFITEFDESAIRHQLRAWIADPAGGVTNVRSDIYYRIWDLFKEHDIQIPYPQRDIHVSFADGDAGRLVGKDPL